MITVCFFQQDGWTDSSITYCLAQATPSSKALFIVRQRPAQEGDRDFCLGWHFFFSPNNNKKSG